jgi:hypothetical protein
MLPVRFHSPLAPSGTGGFTTGPSPSTVVSGDAASRGVVSQPRLLWRRHCSRRTWICECNPTAGWWCQCARKSAFILEGMVPAMGQAQAKGLLQQANYRWPCRLYRHLTARRLGLVFSIRQRDLMQVGGGWSSLCCAPTA